MIFADAMTGGYIAGAIGAILVALICVASVAFGVASTRRGDYGGGVVVAGIASVLLAVTAAVWVWASWPPFAYDYHHWVDKTVTVAAISKRQVSDGDKGFYEKFVVRTRDGGLYGIDDTRAALVKPGDTLSLRCKKAYQFGVPRSAHGWDCRWSA